MSSASLSRYALSLGARDATSGHCAKSYALSTIIGSIQPKGAVMGALPVGNYATYPQTLFTPDAIHIGDHVKDSQGSYYEVRAADQWWRLNQFSHYVCNLEKISPYDPTRPDTSATWHTDSDGTKTDPRERTITWLNLYDNPAVIGGTYAYMFGGADYPFQLEFIDNALDALYVVEAPDSTPEYTYNNYIYKFKESVDIHIYAINRTAISAPVILEQMEQQIRVIATNYANIRTSLRTNTTTKNEQVKLGGLTLWHTIVNLRYSRPNDDYTPPSDTLTWGTGGAPGTFTFPNIINYKNPFGNRDNFTDMSGRQGDYPFLLGAKSDTIDVTCDLNTEPWSGEATDTKISWQRPQTTGTKTDSIKWQVFKDIVSNGAINQTSQVLTVAGESHAVRLKAELELSPNQHRITLHFTEYNPTPASTTYKTRHGIT